MLLRGKLKVVPRIGSVEFLKHVRSIYFERILIYYNTLYREEVLNVFKHDAEYEINEEKYQEIKKELLGEDSSGESGGSSSDESGSESEKEDKDGEEDTSAPIIDQTETNMIALRRTIYLTIQSSLDFEETVHKLMKLNLKPGHEPELCHMIIGKLLHYKEMNNFT